MLIDEIKKYPSSWMYDHLRTVFSKIDEEELNNRITEFLKFIYLVSLDGPSFIPVIKEVDYIWHEYILQTREYEQLCMALPGKRFIHHQSGSLAVYSKTKNKREVVSRMLKWLPRYYLYFGEFTEKTARYWTIVRFLSSEFNLTLAEINTLARTGVAMYPQAA